MFNFQEKDFVSLITTLIIKITISSLVIGLKMSYFPLIRLPSSFNLVPIAHVPFGQHQDTELWNNQFLETKILGLPASRRMPGLVYLASRDKVDADTFHKGIQYALAWKN